MKFKILEFDLFSSRYKRPEENDRATVYLVDYQLRELEKYRLAVHKMGSDILTLRQQIREQESVNATLRRELTNYNDATKMLLDSTEVDGLTKPELAARYGKWKETETNDHYCTHQSLYNR